MEENSDHDPEVGAEQPVETVALDVIHTTILHVVQHLSVVKIGRSFDEEFITGNLFGGISACFPLFSAILGGDHPANRELFWGQFKKSRSKRGHEKEYEAGSGADFAIAICVDDDDYRVAMFQAKCALNRRIDVHQRPPKPEPVPDPSDPTAAKRIEPTWREAQLVVLVNKGLEIMGLIQSRRKTAVEDLHWVHYVCYGDEGMRCLPVCDMKGKYEEEKTNLSKNYVEITDRHTTFQDLIDRGLGEWRTPAQSNGWLRFNRERAASVFPTFLELTDLYFADQGTDRRALSLGLPNATQFVDKIVADPFATDVIAERLKQARAATQNATTQTPGHRRRKLT